MNGPRNDDGFTLVELLVSIIILGTIMGAIAGALIMVLGTSTTQTRLAESHDEQLAAAHFAGDLASAESFTPRSTPCASSGVFLSLKWTDPSTGSTVYVDYAQQGSDVLRSTCIDSGSASTVAVAHDAASVGCVKATGAAMTCPTGSSSPSFSGVKITEASGQSFTLTGTRRAS